MSRSTDVDHFFQTSDNLATTQRKQAKSKNKHGSPLVLPSKILALEQDPDDDSVFYVAEAAGTVRRISTAEAGSKKTVLNGASAPLTSLAITPSRSLYAGCWDKLVYSAKLDQHGKRGSFRAHADFVKCILAPRFKLSGHELLLTGGGGADSSVIVWSITDGKKTKLHALKTTKALQDLAVDPIELLETRDGDVESFTLFTATSDREIRRWHVSIESAYELSDSIDNPILAHETSVYKLRFDSVGDLWTASADKTAKHVVRSRNWKSDTTLPHPDFVRDLVVAEDRGLVVTACRDEEVRVWDIASGSLICMYSGHYEEVTGLVLLGSLVVSVSIDATVRKWSLDRSEMHRFIKQMDEESNGEAKEVDKKEGVLTAEEEAELAELMDDGD